MASHYRELTEPRIRHDDARPLLAGARKRRCPLSTETCRASREFIGKIVERLHREVRYTGVEFGEARLVPEFPAETLRRKFGDCKDKSTLLVAALRASGIEAYLALLSAVTARTCCRICRASACSITPSCSCRPPRPATRICG